ncbi:uncharacterized protein AMSG_00114 [Thecamonas trahens ATCC 50062]|uniref:Uncharacterized protein n=1 Tax=Thecamonas trahens ATCC 50062 TaxID=461836 RepID=A0A0L0D192_THETB|nr:hypothetical protein AMSG_00114 [Thecamonas trahens ATCC 50062]KNC45996.1 hypothetical protein AMSG_00114 [Thecamonas trahens ATCC 50062]|eukprot:XP_013762976.1 hypothetical protein AMSG_00114 [Thecamonas trahens ATCC 50062]
MGMDMDMETGSGMGVAGVATGAEARPGAGGEASGANTPPRSSRAGRTIATQTPVQGGRSGRRNSSSSAEAGEGRESNVYAEVAAAEQTLDGSLLMGSMRRGEDNGAAGGGGGGGDVGGVGGSRAVRSDGKVGATEMARRWASWVWVCCLGPRPSSAASGRPPLTSDEEAELGNRRAAAVMCGIAFVLAFPAVFVGVSTWSAAECTEPLGEHLVVNGVVGACSALAYAVAYLNRDKVYVNLVQYTVVGLLVLFGVVWNVLGVMWYSWSAQCVRDTPSQALDTLRGFVFGYIVLNTFLELFSCSFLYCFGYWAALGSGDSDDEWEVVAVAPVGDKVVNEPHISPLRGVEVGGAGETSVLDATLSGSDEECRRESASRSVESDESSFEESDRGSGWGGGKVLPPIGAPNSGVVHNNWLGASGGLGRGGGAGWGSVEGEEV